MPAIDPFEAERKTLVGLMGENTFFIPDLQRPFSWGEEQVEDLLNDVHAVLRANEIPEVPEQALNHAHFLGTIVTQKQDGMARLAILDGQQRLTCLTLLISLVAREASNVRSLCSSEAETLRVDYVIDRLRSLILQEPDGLGNRLPRLEASPEVALTLASFIRGEDGEVPAESLAPAMNLRKAARQIKKSLLTDYKKKDLEEQILYFVSLQHCICKQLLTIHMSTQAGDAAFSIFESLNARGEPLAMLDLLKIWVMSEMVGHPQESEVTQTLRNLATSRFTEEKPDKFFETYFTIRNFGRKPRASGRRREKLFSIEFRDQLLKPQDEDNHDNHDLIRQKIVETFRHANQIRPYYDAIANRQYRGILPSIANYPVQGSQVFHESRLDALLSPPLGHDLAIPLLVRAAEVLQSNVVAMHELVHDVERLFFRIKVIGDCHAQVLTHAYRSLFEAFENGTYTDALRKEKFRELVKAQSQDDVFDASLRLKLRYKPDGSNLLIKYFLWMVELYSANPAPAQKTFDLQTMSIEHIYPQSADPDILSNGEDDLHRLGNLCLLTVQENSSMSNRPFEEKRAKALEWFNEDRPMECHHSSQAFLEYEEWGTSEIEKMEDHLCNRARSIFSF